MTLSKTTFSRRQSIVILRVIMLNFVILKVANNPLMRSVIMLNVVALWFVAPNRAPQHSA
jgi:hypothetical protein